MYKENFNDKIVVVTGENSDIGKCIYEVFEKSGAKVWTIDINDNFYFRGDIGDKNTSEESANRVLFICSDKIGFITGENIYIDGGMTK